MGALLETIHSPADLKRLNPAQMEEWRRRFAHTSSRPFPRPAAISVPISVWSS